MTPLQSNHLPAQAVADQLAQHRVSVIDVREPMEYASGHIAGSRNVPLAQLGDANLPPHPQEAVASSHRVWTALCGIEQTCEPSGFGANIRPPLGHLDDMTLGGLKLGDWSD
ncbi:MAG: rhodanese-like domain-containing protein [Cyanobacteriota bacterium]|jgi:hypothetical protein